MTKEEIAHVIKAAAHLTSAAAHLTMAAPEFQKKGTIAKLLDEAQQLTAFAADLGK